MLEIDLKMKAERSFILCFNAIFFIINGFVVHYSNWLIPFAISLDPQECRTSEIISHSAMHENISMVSDLVGSGHCIELPGPKLREI